MAKPRKSKMKSSRMVTASGEIVEFATEESPSEESTSEELTSGRALTEDIFSLIYVESFWSYPFLVASFIFSFQLVFAVLILTDLTHGSSDNNRLGVPPGVAIEVTIAQHFGVVLIALTSALTGDLTNGVLSLLDGYNKKVLHTCPNATFLKWLASALAQFCIGAMAVICTFVLVIQSETVIDMCLDFAALEFVFFTDELAFQLGVKGYMGTSFKVACVNVGKIMVPKSSRGKNGGENGWHRPMVLTFVALGVLVPFYVFSARQWRGEFLCQQIHIQFGDEFVFPLGFFTGIFYQDNDRGRVNQRVTYKDATGMLHLAYCDLIEAWTVSLGGECDGSQIWASSSVTTTFDVGSHREGWFFRHPETNIRVPADRLVMQCLDCDSGISGNCPPDYGTCSNNQCVCHENRFGLFCEHQEPCEPLQHDARTERLPPVDGIPFSTGSLRVLRDSNGEMVQLNYRPVFLSDEYFDPDLLFGRLMVAFFGRRWAITYDVFLYHEFHSCWVNLVDLLDDRNLTRIDEAVQRCPEPSIDDLANYLRNEFHPLDLDGSRYVPYFFSTPMDFGTPSDAATPIDKTWFRANRKNFARVWSVDPTQPIGTVLLCSTCNTTFNPCFNFNTCDDETGLCSCQEFETGALCERTLSCLDDGIDCYVNGTCGADGICDCGAPGLGHLCQFALS